MKHPHAEILQAIAEDKDTEIEYWNDTGNEWRKTSIALVLTSDMYERYRIKPKPRLATAPVWDEASEAMLHLNTIESVLGGANGPTIRLRAILSKRAAAVQEPVAWEWYDKDGEHHLDPIEPADYMFPIRVNPLYLARPVVVQIDDAQEKADTRRAEFDAEMRRDAFGEVS